MRLGSEEHKQLFCQSFLDTHLDYQPEKLPFPKLDKMHLNRLKSIPFWREALTIELEAGKMVSAFAETIDDPLIKKAIALQGEEEKRHARLIKHLLDYYEIEIKTPTQSELPKNILSEFVKFGFSECLDSFFAFGMFGIAKQVQYLPEVFFTIFDPILDEEARHIVFFVNWITYHEIQSGRGFLPLRGINTVLGYFNAIRDLISSFGDIDLGGEKDNNDEKTNTFTASGANHFREDLTPKLFLSTCLKENQQRMAKYSPDLLQPKLFPRFSSIAYQFLKLIPSQHSSQPLQTN